MDGLWARGENGTPNPKHQTPEKSQTSNSKTGRRLAALELGTWSFFGVWSLVFGVLIGGRISPLPDPPHYSVVRRGNRPRAWWWCQDAPQSRQKSFFYRASASKLI